LNAPGSRIFGTKFAIVVELIEAKTTTEKIVSDIFTLQNYLPGF
jgi:hypothetical protein